MQNRFAVIGMGRLGVEVARTLAEDGAEVIAIDYSEQKVEDIKDDVAYAIQFDATDPRMLRAQNIQSVDAVVVAIGENFESLLLCTTHLLDMDVPRVIARANTSTQRMILQKIGVKEIISPEEDVGHSLANKLLNPSFINFIPLPDEYEIVEIQTPSNVVNRTVGDIDLRQRYQLNLITIKRGFEPTEEGEQKPEYHVVGVPDPDTVLEENDTLILMGKGDDINRFIEINN